jgi:hypothetical protein
MANVTSIQVKYIYRDYSCQLSKKKCAELLQALALTRGRITSNFTLNNGYSDASVNRWEMVFGLKFGLQEDLDRFHSMGFQTFEPKQVTGMDVD